MLGTIAQARWLLVRCKEKRGREKNKSSSAPDVECQDPMGSETSSFILRMEKYPTHARSG